MRNARTRLLTLLFLLPGAPAFGIVGGQIYDGEPAVVALTDAAGDAYCSGVLITDRIVLTAASCIADRAEVFVFFGLVTPSSEARFPAERVELAPGFSGGGMDDLGMVVLPTGLEDLPRPLGYSRRSPAGTAWPSLRLLGYGKQRIPDGVEGVKRHGVARGLMLGASRLSYPGPMSNTCGADVGGPALGFHDGVWSVWGISAGLQGDCLRNHGNLRLDLATAQIDAWVEEVHGQPDPCVANDFYNDGVCDPFCPGPDPDISEADLDGDGVCDALDQCLGEDDRGDADGDGFCDDIELCHGDDASGDLDLDGWCAADETGEVVDCADRRADRHPGAVELCNGLDDDCSGEVDGWELDEDRDGFAPCMDDCREGDPSVHPGALELCNGFDDNCDGRIARRELDRDRDGVLPCAGDCRDLDVSIPGAERCDDGVDNDCDGVVDEHCAEGSDPAQALDGTDREPRCDVNGMGCRDCSDQWFERASMSLLLAFGGLRMRVRRYGSLSE